MRFHFFFFKPFVFVLSASISSDVKKQRKKKQIETETIGEQFPLR